MATIRTIHGWKEESALQCRVTVDENDDRKVTMTEYCYRMCEGLAHKTGVADAPECFCRRHIRRDVDAVAKRWPEEMKAEIQELPK